MNENKRQKTGTMCAFSKNPDFWYIIHKIKLSIEGGLTVQKNKSKNLNQKICRYS